MRFSIRTLLAFTFLVALALLAWRTFEDAQRDGARAALLQNEITVLSSKVRLDKPELHTAMLTAQDEYDSLHLMRERSLTQFDELRRKYGSMEPRGSDVFSIRGIPTPPNDDGSTAVEYRMLVPEGRPAWLKLGVHLADKSGQSFETSDDFSDLLNDSPFDASGPFELQLPSGDQTLTILSCPVVEGSLTIVLTLSDQVILRTSYVSNDVSGAGSSHITAASQIDYGPRQSLPWLLTAKISARTPDPGSTTSRKHGLSIWLSDRSSNFQGFPGE